MTQVQRDMPLVELAALVCQTLKDHGIDAVLTGGSVVSIYASNPYPSLDLDFVTAGISKKCAAALAPLGFVKDGKYLTHPESDYFLDFPAPPLAIGDDPVRPEDLTLMECATGRLTLLSPTHCVMDRLAAFYYWNDRQALEQAVLVARSHPIRWKEVERWSHRENKQAQFTAFRRQIEGAGG